MTQDYGLWWLVILNSALMVVFAASFFHPRGSRDWRVMGGYSAFVVALFTEMYGTPLTVYLLSGWLGSRFPALQATHSGGHLWNDLIGWQGDPHVSPFHLASYVALIGGFWLIASAWQVLHDSAQRGELATTGAYAWLRHPQYLGFLLVMAGWLLQWPTIPTLLMFPILAAVYARLARAEEHEVAARFDRDWTAYATRVHRYIPHRPQASPPVYRTISRLDWEPLDEENHDAYAGNRRRRGCAAGEGRREVVPRGRNAASSRCCKAPTSPAPR
jgi:protein-S-isoprenylcysteine O-methyltransferase Ste14